MNFILKFYLFFPEESKPLGVAQAARGIAIVTSNKPHFPKEKCEGVKKLSPAELLEVLGRRP
jgi:hypothetical protein